MEFHFWRFIEKISITALAHYDTVLHYNSEVLLSLASKCIGQTYPKKKRIGKKTFMSIAMFDYHTLNN